MMKKALRNKQGSTRPKTSNLPEHNSTIPCQSPNSLPLPARCGYPSDFSEAIVFSPPPPPPHILAFRKVFLTTYQCPSILLGWERHCVGTVYCLHIHLTHWPSQSLNPDLSIKSSAYQSQATASQTKSEAQPFLLEQIKVKSQLTQHHFWRHPIRGTHHSVPKKQQWFTTL